MGTSKRSTLNAAFVIRHSQFSTIHSQLFFCILNKLIIFVMSLCRLFSSPPNGQIPLFKTRTAGSKLVQHTSLSFVVYGQSVFQELRYRHLTELSKHSHNEATSFFISFLGHLYSSGTTYLWYTYVCTAANNGQSVIANCLSTGGTAGAAHP